MCVLQWWFTSDYFTPIFRSLLAPCRRKGTATLKQTSTVIVSRKLSCVDKHTVFGFFLLQVSNRKKI